MIVHYYAVHFHVPRAAIICVTVMDAKLVSVEVFAVRPISPFSTMFSFSFVFTCSSPLNNIISYYKVLRDIGQFHSPRMKPYKSTVQ